MAKYITSQRSPRKRRTSPSRDKERRNPRNQKTSEPGKNGKGDDEDKLITKTINVIAEGFAGGRTAKLAHKNTSKRS